MTPQTLDYVNYGDEKYWLAGFSGEQFPIPETFSLELLDHRPTNCNRGFVTMYEVKENRLYTYSLQLGAKSYPPIEGIEADFSGMKDNWGAYLLNLPSQFTGGMMIGRYVWWGDPLIARYTPQSFQDILELVFENGLLQETIDHSTTIQELRVTIAEQMGLSTSQKPATKFKGGSLIDRAGRENKWNEIAVENKRREPIYYELEKHLSDVWKYQYEPLP